MNDSPVRDKLARAMADASDEYDPRDWRDYLRDADALLPIVREIAAEELREAADDIDANTTHVCNNPDIVRENADALTKPPDGPVR